VKAYPFTRQFGNPAVVGTAAGIGGASALAFTLARHALRKTLARRAQQRVSAASPAAQLVTSHPETVDKAREWASAQWSPYLGLELGALVGAVGPAAFTAAQPDSSHGSTALRAGIGAGIGGLAGLGIGYLYRKRKQREFLEHVEREMTDMNSPKAQEAVTQAAVEKDNAPLNKVAEEGGSEERRRKLIRALGAIGVIGGGASAAGAYALVPSYPREKIQQFSDVLTSWSSGKEDPRFIGKQYDILGSEALKSLPFSGVDAIKAYRSSPFSPVPWSPSSGQHYAEFEKEPVFAYLQIAREAGDTADTSEAAKTLRAYISAARSTAEGYRRTGEIRPPNWFVPSVFSGSDDTSQEGLRSYKENLRSVFDELEAHYKSTRSTAAPSRTAPRPTVDYHHFAHPKEALPELTAGLRQVSQKLFGTDNLDTLTPDQQGRLILEADQHLKTDNPELWSKKQLFDTGVGATRYAARDFYPRQLNPAMQVRDLALYGGLALAGLGSAALLYSWLASRKDPKKQKEQDHVDTTDYDLGRLEKAATTMVKDAVDGLARRPFVATNAPLMRGMGGPPDRFGSTALGARRLKKWAEDDPNALGEEVDDVVLAAVRASEEQHGPRKRIEVSNDDVKPAECGPSQQKIGESSTQLPYRKRAEVVAIKDGKIYGGVYKDGGFGFFGGGVDDDNLEDAAVREFAEETGLSIKNPKQLDVSPVSEDWRPPYSSEKMRERAKNYRGSTTYFVVADLDDSSPTSKATGDDGRSSIKQPRLYDMNEVQKLLSVDVPEQYVPITEGRRAAVNAVRTLGQQKVADVAQLLPRKEVLYFTPTGKLAVRPSTGRRIDLPTDIEGKPVPYEQPVTVLPEGGVPEKGVHGYQVSLQSAEGDLPEGFEEVDPQEALKNLYAAMGKPENRQYQALDRARARALLRIIKKRLPA
jgi:8-oxo-dGTP pyrophosphatase MutT (NUDIX family)